MFFLKRVFLGLGFIFLIYMGGSGTQSNSLFMQGMGFLGLLVGLIVLYVFGRMVWKGLGCLPSFLILAAIVLFIMYALGMFNNGLSGVGQSMLKFIGRDSADNSTQMSEMPEMVADSSQETVLSENFPDAAEVAGVEKPLANLTSNNAAPTPSPDLFGSGTVPAPLGAEQPAVEKNPSLADSVISALTGGENQQRQPKQFNPNNYPVVYGSVRVINGDTLEMYGKYFKLFGVDAPETSQTCADRQGRAYNCGREAAMWLKSWIGDNELECRVVQQDTKGNMVGTCSYGPYDIGAALVNAGWAVAYTKYTDIYYPYEIQAQANRRGLWQGTFYKPWDWRKLQARKPKIKVIKPKKRKEGLFG